MRVLNFLCSIMISLCTTVSARASLNFQYADSTILAAIADSLIPGAVLCVVDNQEIVYLQAYGNRCVVPEKELMTSNTIFDLASVSKPLGAGSSM